MIRLNLSESNLPTRTYDISSMPLLLLGFISFPLFFHYSLFLLYDSAHYLSYLPILNGTASMESWDIVRGPTFPVYLWLTTKILGTSASAVLTVNFITYVLTLYLYYLSALKVLPVHTARQKVCTIFIIYIFIGLNPLVFGYYHIMLTEHLASFFLALIIYVSVLYYEKLISGMYDKKYHVYQAAFIFLCPVIYFLRQNYLMLILCAAIAIILLTALQKRGKRCILRAAGLLGGMLLSLVISISVWNSILPEPESAYMESRSANRLMAYLIFTPETEYIRYTIETDGVVVSFYNTKGIFVDSYTIPGITEYRQLSLKQCFGILLKNISTHPLLYARGVLDAYLAAGNFYGTATDDGIGYSAVKNASMFRANENNAIGYRLYYDSFSTNIPYINPSNRLLNEQAKQFEDFKPSDARFSIVFMNLRKPVNFTFTLGFMLLPLIWVTSIILSTIYKKETAFILALITSTASFGYLMLNAVSDVVLDRYAFPVYIPVWIAILSVIYGVYKNIKPRRQGGKLHVS